MNVPEPCPQTPEARTVQNLCRWQVTDCMHFVMAQSPVIVLHKLIDPSGIYHPGKDPKTKTTNERENSTIIFHS